MPNCLVLRCLSVSKASERLVETEEMYKKSIMWEERGGGRGKVKKQIESIN